MADICPWQVRGTQFLNMRLVSLGDQAVLAYFPREIHALHFAAAVRTAAPAWLIDVVQAYTSVAVFFDLNQTRLAEVDAYLRKLEREGAHLVSVAEGRLHGIPCCYEFQLDLQ